jgi:hypothetical protein
MVLLSKPESHLAPKRRNDDESDAGTRTHSQSFRKNNQSLPDISHAILRSVMRFASLLRDIEGKVLNPQRPNASWKRRSAGERFSVCRKNSYLERFAS